MLALEMTVPIANHRLVVEDAALPDNAERARVIVMWESVRSAGRRSPPLSLAGSGVEKGDIISSAPMDDWEALS